MKSNSNIKILMITLRMLFWTENVIKIERGLLIGKFATSEGLLFWSPFYGTATMIFFRCKEKLTVVFDLGKGGKAVVYVYYIIHFSFWNSSFEGRDGKSELQGAVQTKRG